MQNLKITLIQTITQWHNINANLEWYGEKIDAINHDTDLIILPETFSTGFTMDSTQAETLRGQALEWLKSKAKFKNCTIAGSVIVNEDEKIYNRLIWMKPNGTFTSYNKRHLFRMAEEDKYFTEGNELLIEDLKGWKICPLVCYDLRFPVWSRNKGPGKSFKYDLAIYVANWPQVRISAWDALLKARAIENLSYIVGLNRIGEDGNQIQYNGHSCAFGPKGETLFFNEGDDIIKTIELDKNQLDDYRGKFPTNLDADDFVIGN